MATTLYLTGQQWASTLGARGRNDTRLSGAAASWQMLRLSTARGAGATTDTATGTTGPTNGVEPERTGGRLEWLSEPLAAAATISGTITFNIWANEIAMADNCGAQVVVERVDETGAIISTVINSERGVEMGTSAAAQNWTGAPTSTTFDKGDRIRVRVAINDAGGTMAAAGNFPAFVTGGTTGGASGDSFVTFTENLTFIQAAAAGTVYFMTDNPSDIVDQGTSEKALSRIGTAAVVTKNVNTVAGWTTPVPWTDGAGGQTLEWFTPALKAFDLAGFVRVVGSFNTSNAASLAAAGCEVAVVANDGTNVRVYGTFVVAGAMLAAGRILFNMDVAGDTIHVAEGERVRVRFFIDDYQNPMVTGHTCAVGYGASGTLSGADVSGVQFTETVFEAETFGGSGRQRYGGIPGELQRRRPSFPAQDFTSTGVVGPVTETPIFGGAVAAGPATTQAVVTLGPQTGAIAGGSAPLPQAIPSRGASTGSGPTTTAAIVTVTVQGAPAGGNSPFPQAIPARGGSVAGGTGPTSNVTVTSQGAPAAGNTPAPQVFPARGGSLGGGTGPTSNAVLTSQGATAAGLYGTGVATASIGSSTGNGTAPVPTAPITSQGAVGSGANTTTSSTTVTQGGGVGIGTSPNPNAPVPQGGAPAPGTGPGAVVTFTSQGATAGGFPPVATGLAIFTIQGATAQGNTPAPQAVLASQGALGSGTNTTSSTTVTAGGGVGFGTSPNPNAPVPQGGAPAPGTGPGAVVTLTSQGAVAGGPAPTDSTGTAETPAPGGSVGSGTGPLAVVGVTSQGAVAAGQTPLPQAVLTSQGALGVGRPASPTSSVTPGGGTADDGTILPTVAVISQGAPAAGSAPGAVVVVGRGAAVAGGTAPTEYYFEVPGRGGAIGSGNTPTINVTSATGGSVAGGPNQSATISIAPGAGSANGNGPTAIVIFGPGSATGAGNAPSENQSETAIGGAVASGNDSTAVVSLTAGEALAGGHAPSAPLSEQPDIGASTASGNAPAAAVPPDQGGSTTISTGPTAYVTFAPGAAIGAGNAPTEIGVTPPTPAGPTPGSGNAKRVRVLHNRIEILDDVRDEDEEEALLLLGLSLE